MGYERGLIKRYAGNGIYLYLDYIVQSNTKYNCSSAATRCWNNTLI